MPIITLTTDMGMKDHYVGAVKGTILSICPQATIVDITHNILPFNLPQAAFVLQNACLHFPKNTIHIVSVGGEGTAENPYIGIEYKEQFFLGSDNGLFSLAFGESPEKAVQLFHPSNIAFSFPERTILAPAAARLAQNGVLEEIGEPLEKLRRQPSLLPVSGPDFIRGHILYIDAYGNAICNITRDLFMSIAKDRRHTIYLGGRMYRINRISLRYSDKAEGELVAIFNDAGYLEIAINKGAEGSGGSAASLVGLQAEQSIGIEFATSNVPG